LQFQNIDLTPYIGDTGLSSLTVSGVTFSDSHATFSILSGGILAQDIAGGTLNVTLPTGTLAFGLNLLTSGGFLNDTVDFIGDGSEYNNGFSTPSYFGARDSSSLTGLNFTATINGTNKFELSSFEIGTSGSSGDSGDAPEAATLLLIGTGLIAMRFLRKWSRKPGAPRKASEAAGGYVNPQLLAN